MVSEKAPHAAVSDDEQTPTTEPGSVHFWSGNALLPTDVIGLPFSRPPQVVILAGDSDAGKTTLLASIYELFRDGPVGGTVFGGSRTLRAFEERCHDARVKSGRTDPTTLHTPLSNTPSFLHLNLHCPDTSRERVDLLISDVNGERYSRAASSAAECCLLEELKRADQIVLLLDGERLVDRARRQKVLQGSQTFIRRALECEMITEHSRLEIVTSKWDLIARCVDQEASNFIRHIETTLRLVVNDRIERLTFDKIAARPDSKPDLGFAFGIPGLISRWLGEGCKSFRSPTPPKGEPAARQREFARFGFLTCSSGESQ